MRVARQLIFFPVLFLLMLLVGAETNAQTAPSASSSWDLEVDSLVTKIAADGAKTNSISLKVTNISSLSASGFEATRAAVEKALQQRGFQLQSSAGAETTVDLTLSENLNEYLWVARIRQGDAERTVILSFPHHTPPPGEKPETTIYLQRQFIWEQSGKMLDFAVDLSGAPGDIGYIVLEPDRLAFYKRAQSQTSPDHAVAIASAKPRPRDVRGMINLASESAKLPGVECAGTFEHPDTVRCQEVPEDKETSSALAGTTMTINGRSVEAVKVPGACVPLVLASGGGDWTVPDAIRAYTEWNHQLTALGNSLEFTGPVLAMWPADDGKSARVISRNLQTGMYEASIVSVTCNR